jgi:hypothetical protein
MTMETASYYEQATFWKRSPMFVSGYRAYPFLVFLISMFKNLIPTLKKQ